MTPPIQNIHPPPLRRSLAAGLLKAYKRVLSPVIHAATGNLGACRFQPTCSEYAAIAFSTRGIFRGSLLTLSRFLRCNPLFAGGFDPVPGTYTVAQPSPVTTANYSQRVMQTSTPPVTIEKSGELAALHSVSRLQPQQDPR